MLMKHKTLFWIDFYHLTILLRNLLTAKEGRDNFGKNNMVGPFHNQEKPWGGSCQFSKNKKMIKSPGEAVSDQNKSHFFGFFVSLSFGVVFFSFLAPLIVPAILPASCNSSRTFGKSLGSGVEDSQQRSLLDLYAFNQGNLIAHSVAVCSRVCQIQLSLHVFLCLVSEKMEEK